MSAGLANVVVLRNLYLNAQGGTHGILYQSAAALHVEQLVINGFTARGIWMDLTTAAELYVADTIVRNNGASGIYLSSGSGFANVSIVRALVENNVYGVFVASNASASVKDTVAAGNNLYGFAASSGSTGVQLDLEGCVASGNGYGVYAASSSGTAAVRVSNCSVTGNATGVLVSTNAFILSRGNNTLEGNATTNGSFSGIFAAK